MKPKAEWAAAATTLSSDICSFSGGVAERNNGEVAEHISPLSGRVDYVSHFVSIEDLDAVVILARRRFEEGVWSRRDPIERRDVLFRLCALIEEHAEELALYETLDTGKAISDSYLRDVPGSVGTLRWYAGAIDKLYGERAPAGSGVVATVHLEPVGVVGAVIPWNFPIETLMWKVAPALALGNSVILKPDEHSSRTALRVAELAVEAGVPEGVFSVVLGGPKIGRAIGLHPLIDALSFTGSTEVGKLFQSYSAQSNLKLVSLECGGKSVNLIFADCENMETAAAFAAAGIFYNQGQVCSANSRLLVEASIAEDFTARVIAAAADYSPGSPLDPDTAVGAMIGLSHRDRVMGMVTTAAAQGGVIRCGGVAKVVDGYDNYLEPTVITGLSSDAELIREEAFGPVLTVQTFDNETAAVEMANGSEFALAASVWSGGFARAHRVAERLRAGTVSVNMVDALHPSVPFGGFASSGFGRDLSLHAFRNYGQPKTTWFDYRQH